VENVTEAVARLMKKHSVPVAMSMKPYRTLKTVRHLVRFGQCWVRFGQCWVRFGQFRLDSVRFGELQDRTR